jgi:hypothetical protein
MSLKGGTKGDWEIPFWIGDEKSVAVVVEAVGMWESRSDFQARWKGPQGLSTERHFHSHTAVEMAYTWVACALCG